MDGLRGLLVIGIVGCHASYANWANGFPGALDFSLGMVIYAFFGLSAFLLYRPYVAARAAGAPAPSTREYLRRRALRIIPAYWVALTLLAIWPGVKGVFSDHWFAYYGFLQIYRGHWASGGLPQAWSVCVEVTFYLALPLYAAVVRRIRPHGRWLAVELAAALTVVLAGLAVRAAGAAGAVSSLVMVALPGWLAVFGVGMGLAVLSVGVSNGALTPGARAALVRWAWLAPLGAVALYVAQAAVYGLPPNIYAWLLPLAGQTATRLGDVGLELGRQSILIGIALFLLWGPIFGEPRGVFHRLLNVRWLVWLGVVSYAFYLYHVSLLFKLAGYLAVNRIEFFGHPSLGTVVLTLCVTAPVAYFSYRHIELPFLKRKERARDDTRRSGTRRGARLPGRLPA